MSCKQLYLGTLPYIYETFTLRFPSSFDERRFDTLAGLYGGPNCLRFIKNLVIEPEENQHDESKYTVVVYLLSLLEEGQLRKFWLKHRFDPTQGLPIAVFDVFQSRQCNVLPLQLGPLKSSESLSAYRLQQHQHRTHLSHLHLLHGVPSRFPANEKHHRRCRLSCHSTWVCAS